MRGKKLIALITGLVLLLTPIAVSAEITQEELSSYSYEQLVELEKLVDAEMQTRPEHVVTVLQPGQYIVGRDLEPGLYTLGFSKSKEEDKYSEYFVYESIEMYQYDVDRLFLGDLPLVKGSLQEGSKINVELYDGQCFVAYRSGVTIERIGDVPEIDTDYEVPEGTAIPKGIYSVGDDIPADKYSIIYNGKGTARVRAYADPSKATNDFETPEFEFVLNRDNSETVVTLKEGWALRIEYNDIIMKKSQGFVFD